MTHCLARLRRCEHGAAAVEFALVGLVALVLFLGIIEFGRGFYMRNEMSYAMDLAERKILTKPTVANAEVETVIRNAISFNTSAGLLITFGTTSVNGLPFRTVLIRYPVTLLIPGLTNNSFTLKIDRIVPIGSS
ncbi:MAG: TadE/TadG family type IV pilus assembly protein [Cypionkella sp.]